MISLEQVQLLETRVSKAIEYVKRVTAENAALAAEKTGLQKKLEANQKRIDELEVLVMRFKEDQGRIEDGIVAALDRLSQFEEAFENSLKESGTAKKTTAKPREKAADVSDKKPAEGKSTDSKSTDRMSTDSKSDDSSKEIYFDITEKDTAASDTSDDTPNDDLSSEGELDIF